MDSNFKRLPPQNIEAERAVLGSAMVSGECYNAMVGLVVPGDFYRAEHQLIFKAMISLDCPPDILLVCNHLKKTKELDKVGGPAYLAQLTDEVIPSENTTSRFSVILKECSKMRRFIFKTSGMIDMCYDNQDFTNTVATLEKEAFALSEDIGRHGEARKISDISSEAFDKIVLVHEGKAPPGLKTGFESIDNMTSGLQGGDLVIIAGRPSMGKTALGMNILRRVADQKIPCGAFSLEMNDESLGMRLISEVSRVNGVALKTGFIRDNQWPALTKSLGYLSNMPLYVDDSPALNISEIRSRARSMKNKYDVGLILVDYLQLAKGNGDSREQEISSISSGLKAMAKELDIPVIALSQLNRSLESRPNKRPKLSDLRESGAIEQDADIIMFIYRDEVYDTSPNNQHKGIAEIIFGKQRSGPIGTVKMAWLKDCTAFEDLAK